MIAMGVVAQTKVSNDSTERPESPFRVIFGRAYSRIGNYWSIYIWEIIAWSFLGWRLGSDFWGHHNEGTAKVMAIFFWWATVVLSPMLIGPWIYHVHVRTQTLDDNIKILPITPATFLGARIAAVGLLWLRVFGPLLLTSFHLYSTQVGDYFSMQRWNYISLKGLEFFDWLLLTNRPDLLGMLKENILIALLFTMVAGWFTLPFCWGIYWGTRIRGNVFYYYIAYYSYLVITLAYIGVAGLVPGISTHKFMDIGFSMFWSSLVGLSGLIISVIMFWLACRLMGRRS